MLDIQAIKEAKAAREPFSFFQAQVLAEDDLNQIRADFPAIEKPGVFPVGRAAIRAGLRLALERHPVARARRSRRRKARASI